jgi:Phytanoyl-CoA dioxygenase (PhyH)
VSQGVAVLPDYMATSDAAQLLAACEELLDEAQSGARPDETFSLYPDVLLRVARADRLVPETAAFFQDPMIESLARAATAPRAISYRRELEVRFGKEKMNQADLFHFDNWRPIIKAFLYLTDVGEENAPFVYLPGSHNLGSWRRRHEVAFDVDGPSGRFGFFFPQEIRTLTQEHGWRELVCTGSAGTLILADLRGLHRGTPLLSGRRVLLNNTFDTMNSEPA